MAIHNGKRAPRLNEDFNPLDDDAFYVVWTTKLDGDTISSSTWTVPTGWTTSSEQTNQSVTIDGITYTDANAVRLTTINSSGEAYIVNNIVTAAGLSLSRGFYIQIDSKL